MNPWLGKEVYSETVLKDSLKVLDIKNKYRKRIEYLIAEYVKNNGILSWTEDELLILQQLVQAILEINDNEFLELDKMELINITKQRLLGVSDEEINEICFYVTYTQEE